jgi:serine/threonine protein kinase
VIEHESRAFIVMEYVEGETLAARLHRGALPVERVVAIGRMIVSAVAAAHAKGIIHRDLKPANVQLTNGGQVKVLDFGIATTLSFFSTVSTDSLHARGSSQRQ